MDPNDMQAQLAHLSKEEREEAMKVMEIAKRAEARAEQRALERALQKKQAEHAHFNKPATKAVSKVAYVPKRKREQQMNGNGSSKAAAAIGSKPIETNGTNTNHQMAAAKKEKLSAPVSTLTEKERQQIEQTYLGKQEKKANKPKEKKKDKSFKKNFRFQWDNTDDTYNAEDPLYAPLPTTKRRKKHNDDLGPQSANIGTVMTKELSDMTTRDWRIVRENFNISVRGGQAPPPLRSFAESNLDERILNAVFHELRFRDPSPIQRQAIPIGLQRRDLIGIAETGSGKTVAFGIPLLQYLLQLPERVLNRVAEHGPLALVMAPTRELALQINVEFEKLLSRQKQVTSTAIVGGQPIQVQAAVLRKGVHIVVGTPGRINDCIEKSYMVLNQCCYIVMDEADRMLDMGFAPQMESILDAMGGTLKSELEEEAYEQEKQDLQGDDVAKHRLTAMFSATMSPEVEGIAKRYLRHPAIVSIAGNSAGKNARIHQSLVWVNNPANKEGALRKILADRRFVYEKVIVFVNEKKHADSVGRMVEKMGRKCVVMHGGKSQEQREDNLERFRQGGVIMVATDVAGRGLDIPDVAHVVNYDLPTQPFEKYVHRIGRTGRAGKEGFATSIITDEDEGIMIDLKNHLQSTGSVVPDRLKRHPAVRGGAEGNLIH